MIITLIIRCRNSPPDTLVNYIRNRNILHIQKLEDFYFQCHSVAGLLLLVDFPTTWTGGLLFSEKLHVEHDHYPIQPADRGGMGRAF